MPDKQRNVPGNTTRETSNDSLGFLVKAMTMGSGGAAIEAQEARGQQSFVNSTTLPTDIKSYDYDAKVILEVAGVKFGDVVEDDPLFQYVELPAGWEKEATDHSMWSNLIDEKGRERAKIFYKAAFYDRSASLSLSRRYKYHRDYDRAKSEGVAVCVVTDCAEAIHTTEPIPLPGERGKCYEEVIGKVDEIAETWLNEHYPEWKNPGAYWD